MYGKYKNGILLISDSVVGGYKPMIFTEMPTAEEGYEANFFWKEEADRFVQTWEIVPVSDEITNEEAFAIITGESV